MNTGSRLITGLGIATMAGAGLVGLYRLLLRQPQAPLDGVVSLPGLNMDVEVVRDRAGVPHLYAADSHDLYYAFGYVHAQDRLWHMELNRRVALGRLSEIFGETTLVFDRFMRRLGFFHPATAELIALEPDERAVLEAYTAGVNAFLNAHRQRLPLEFRLLRSRPRPWEPVDTLAVGKMLSWMLSANWDSEWFRARLVEQLGVDAAAALEPGYPAGHPLTVAPGVSYAGLSDSLIAQFQAAQRDLGSLTGAMSNAWAVRPERSATGGAILASDPHLRAQMPSIWYEAHLTAAGVDVAGATMPGVPAVLIGHNQQIAWGITASMVDTQDLFVERINPDDPSQYETPLGWQPLSTRREDIYVRGRAEAVVEEVQETRHGPSLSPLLPGETRLLTVQSPVFRPQKALRGSLRLHAAQNWQEFRAALADWEVVVNAVYADRDGNVGYQLSGQVPLRGEGTGLLPAPGWDAAYDWHGLIPFEELPSVLNPPSGYVVSANNRLVDDDYPYPLSHDWIEGFRAMRIEDQLRSRERHTLDDFAAMQLDVYSEAAHQLVGLVADVEADNPLSVRALAYLQRWDFCLTPESVAATIYVALRQRLLRNVFGARLGPLLGGYVGSAPVEGIAGSLYPSRVGSFMVDLLRRADPAWLAGQTTFESWAELKRASLAQAVLDLREKLGDDMDTWRWGQLHQLRFDHPFGRVKPLDRIFCRGPWPIGGDADTPCQTALAPGGYAATEWIPSYRQIVDLGNLSNSRSIHTTGQSGLPGSPHYDDFIQPWREGRYHPMLFERKVVLEDLEHMLVLRPR
ncbi:MAG TPA: penicillin acylase family protein [Chloroflexota bacterium]|nr:penicillin acylase family protein [Chloroflexota bacterium]